MATSATIPVTVSPEARERVAELGFQKQLEHMLEHTLQTVPELKRVWVELVHKDEDDDPTIVIWSQKALPAIAGPDFAERTWDEWHARTFPVEVLIHFVMICVYEPENGR